MTLSRYCTPSFHRALALCTALAGGACSTDDLPESNLGNTNDPIVVAPEEGAQRIPVFGENGVDPFIVGDWIGYAEDLFAPPGPAGERPAYVFPSGSSAIYMTLALDPPASPFGQIRFGSLDAPVAQAGVPLGTNDYFVEAAQFADFPVAPVEGFAYELRAAPERFADEDAERWNDAVAVTYVVERAFDEWCAVQPSLFNGQSYSCTGSTGYGGNGKDCDVDLPNGSAQATDCNLVFLCNGSLHPCRCDASGCFNKVPERDRSEESLWIGREGDQLVVLSSEQFQYPELGYQLPIGHIRFERAQP